MSEHQALRIGVVGLGQCGGNFAAEFAKLGYPALAANTSQTDLRSLTGLEDDQRLYLGVDGLNGTGGAMVVGADCLAARGSEIVTAVARWPEVDAVLVIGGLGGGTGANLAWVVEHLAGEECPVIAMAVLPASSESHTAKVNALQGVNALLDVNFDSLIMVDNQKVYKAFANAGLDQFLHEGNFAVASSFDELNSLSGKQDLRSIRSFDPQQFQHTLLSGGLVVFDSRAIDGLTPESLLEAVRSAVVNHPYLGSGYELGDAVVVSAVMVCNADVLADTPATVFEDFSAAIKSESDGADLHAGIYSGDVKSTRVHLMVGGLPLPGRTQELLEEAAQEAERFSTKKAPRKKLKKLDLSGLAALAGGRGLVPPSTGGKGMAKISPVPGGLKESDEAESLVDLDFNDEDMVEEELIGDDMVAADLSPVDEEEFK
jgi:cell division GTPase FtsZ